MLNTLDRPILVVLQALARGDAPPMIPEVCSPAWEVAAQCECLDEDGFLICAWPEYGAESGRLVWAEDHGRYIEMLLVRKGEATEVVLHPDDPALLLPWFVDGLSDGEVQAIVNTYRRIHVNERGRWGYLPPRRPLRLRGDADDEFAWRQ